jgi:hypothetical protein
LGSSLIHHLSARIPNYRLEACHAASPLFSDVPTITPRSSVRSLALSLWDEERQRLISFREEAQAPRGASQRKLLQAPPAPGAAAPHVSARAGTAAPRAPEGRHETT